MQGPRNTVRYVESLRAALPLATYLMLLHRGATTGKIPVLNRFGEAIPDEHTHLSGKSRVELIEKLVAKVMPDKTDPMVTYVTDDNQVESQALTRMSDEDLLRIAHGDPEDATDSDIGRQTFGSTDAGEARTGTEEVPEFFDVPVRGRTP